MRFTYFVAVALTGLLASNDLVVASTADKTVVHDQVLSDRELIDTGLNDNEKRSLRTNEDLEDDSEDLKKSDEERFSLIQLSNQPRYYVWFEDEMTPKDVRRKFGLTRHSIKLVKRSIYRGYVKYYDEHCSYFENRKKDFCRAQEY
ncbi:hypothetical protein DVH05_027839 [Phytophthora capsici]|nr:hypothetical protein DVH05_007175 [Phytophthora capsici]KAG1690790.1 hypothetical protein DVH05_027839 [Phytophthora capsici]|eukprot:jgi/Phyca11/124376/e_gw1.53.334.1